jgi:O-antigen/teichoic acid export membrane protein
MPPGTPMVCIRGSCRISIWIFDLSNHRLPFSSLLPKRPGPDAIGALGRGALATLVVHVLAALLGLLLHVGLTWSLGDETAYGIYLVAISAVNLLAIPITSGWDTVLNRFLSQYSANGISPLGQKVYAIASHRTLLRCGLALPLLALLLIPIFKYGFPASWEGTDAWTFVLMIACVPPLALSLLRQGALKGLHRPALSMIPEAIVKPLAILGILLLLLNLGGRSSGTLALVSHCVASLLAFQLGTYLLPRTLRHAGGWTSILRRPETATDFARELRRDSDQGPMALWKSLALSATIMGLSFAVLNRIDEFLLGILDSPAAAGLYGPASRYAMFVTFGLSVVNPMLGALLARHHDDREELQRLVKRSARLAAVISTPLAIGMMAFPEIPLSLLPPSYQASACVLRILAAAQWINTLFGSVGMVLMMTGHHRDLAIILVVTALLDILLNVLLIPPLGYMGAAIATGIAIVVWNASAWVMVRIRLGINTSAV